MDGIDVEDFTPAGNTAASEAGASSFAAATSPTAAGKPPYCQISADDSGNQNLFVVSTFYFENTP